MSPFRTVPWSRNGTAATSYVYWDTDVHEDGLVAEWLEKVGIATVFYLSI